MLAIAGGKGGSGKTTTTLGVARAVDGPTLAVDADCDLPNLHALAGVPRDPPAGELGHSDPSTDGTRIRPAPRDAPDGMGARLRRLREQARADPPERGSVAESRVERAGRHCGDGQPSVAAAQRPDSGVTILVDCPAGAGPDATVPLRVADGVLLVATPCVAALRDAAKTAAMARAVGTEVVGAVLTRARLVPPGVEDLFDCPVLTTVPDEQDPLQSTAVRRAYDKVAARLSERPKA